MTAETFTNPAEPVAVKKVYGGYAEIARELSAKEPDRARPYSRQLVEKWYKGSRGSKGSKGNGFPQPFQVRAPSGKIKKVFWLEEVEKWLRNRDRDKGKGGTVTVSADQVVPHINTIPMFPIGKDGSPIC